MDLAKFHFSFDWTKVQPTAEELVNIPYQDSLEVNANTSYLNKIQKLDKLDILKDYFNFIIPKVKDYLNTQDELLVEKAWFSKYSSGGYIVPHKHPSCVAVACCYIKFCKNAGNIEFFLNNSWQEVTISEGDVIVFRGDMKHKSQPNNSGFDRWTLTTNFTNSKTI